MHSMDSTKKIGMFVFLMECNLFIRNQYEKKIWQVSLEVVV